MERWEKNLSALNEKNAETAEILKKAKQGGYGVTAPKIQSPVYR